MPLLPDKAAPSLQAHELALDMIDRLQDKRDQLFWKLKIAVDALKEFSRDESEGVQFEAKEALRKIAELDKELPSRKTTSEEI